MKLNFDIDKELQGLRNSGPDPKPKPKKELNFDIDSALNELRTQEKTIPTTNEPKPITKPDTEQIQTQTVTIPDKWNFEISGNTIDEVNSKVDKIKQQFPDVPIEEINGVRNIRIKGNPELSKKVYSYLNNIPYTPDNQPEFKTPEQEVKGEPIDQTSQLLFDLIAPLTTDYSEAESVSKALGLPETAIDDYNNRVYGRSIDERIKTGTEDLKNSISKTAENLLEGIYGSKLGGVKEPGISLAKLGNGIMELSMLPFTAGLTALSVVPGGEPLGKYAFIEPEIMNMAANVVTSKMDIPQEYKDLISNVSVIFGLGLKGKILSDLKGLKNIKPEDVKPIIDQHALDIKNLKEALLKNEYKDENGIKQDLPQEVKDNPISMFDTKKIEDVKEIMLSRNAIQDAIDKYDTERKSVEQKLRNKDLSTKELDELDKELNRLDKNVVNWQKRLKEIPDPLNIETVSTTGANKKPEEIISSPESTSKTIENKGGLKGEENLKPEEIKQSETPSNLPPDEQKQPTKEKLPEKSSRSTGNEQLSKESPKEEPQYQREAPIEKNAELKKYTDQTFGDLVKKFETDDLFYSQDTKSAIKEFDTAKANYEKAQKDGVDRKTLNELQDLKDFWDDFIYRKETIESEAERIINLPDDDFKGYMIGELDSIGEVVSEGKIPMPETIAEVKEIANQLEGTDKLKNILRDAEIEYSLVGARREQVTQKLKNINEAIKYLSERGIGNPTPMKENLIQSERGFVDSKGNSLTREQASNNQVNPEVTPQESYKSDLEKLKSNWEKGKSNQTLGAIGNVNRYAEFISDPENLKLLTKIGKYHIEKGVKKLSDFTEAIVKDLGEWMRPHAEDLWNRINTKPPEPVKTISQTETVKGENAPRPISVVRETKEKKSNFSIGQKIIFETLNRFEPFSRAAKKQGVRYTKEDPTTYAFNLMNKQSIASEWIKGDTTPILQRDGNYTFEKGTVKDYLKDIQGKEKSFEEYLVARRVIEDYKQLDKMKSDVETLEGKKQTDLLEQIQSREKQLRTDNFDINDAQRIVNEREKEFAEVTQKYDDINKKILTFAENTGLISKEKADLYRGQEGYTSFRRDLSEMEDIGGYSSNPSTKLSSMKERTGSGELDIISPIYSQVEAIQEVISKGLENELWNKVYDLSKKNKELGNLFRETDNRPNLKFKKDGKEISISASEELQKVAKTLRGNEVEAFSRFLSLPKDLFTRLTTSANPFFALVNIPRDQLTALFTTKAGIKPVVDPVMAVVDLIKSIKGKGSERLTQYKAMGGERQTFASYMDLPPEKMQRQILMDLQKGVRPKQTALEKTTNIINAGLHVLELPSNISEIATRFSEFKRAKEKGLSDVEAMYYASEVTIPFQQQGNFGGRGGREIVKSIAYFNANLQGLYKTLRSIKEQPGRFSVVAAGLLATSLSSSVLTMTSASDEQKRLLANQQPRELGRAIFIPAPDGKTLIRIPVPELIGGITGLTQLAVINNYSDNKVKFKDYVDALMQGLPNQLGVIEPAQMISSWIPQVVKPTIEATYNTKSYPEIAPIVPDYMKNLTKTEQYTDYTSRVAKFLGKITGSSPMIVEHWIKNQFGSLGNLTMGIGDYTEGDLGRIKSRVGIMRQEEGFILSGRAYNNFYDQKEKVTQEWNSIKDDPNTSKDQKAKVLKLNDQNTKIGEVLSMLRQIVKKDKDLSEELRNKVYTIVLDANNGKDVTRDLISLEKQVESLAERRGIKSKSDKQQDATKRNKELRE